MLKIIRSARKIINKYGNKLSIRTLDALQLGSCLVEEQEGLYFVCADLHLNKICSLEGLLTINPETSDSIQNTSPNDQWRGKILFDESWPLIVGQ